MRLNKSLVTLGASLAMAVTAIVPAHATDFNATADRTSDLNPAGDTVNVTLTDIPSGEGVYVRLCKGTMAEVMQARPSDCFGLGSWVSLDSSNFAYGAGDATQPVALAVQAQFTSGSDSVDCLVQACGIHIRRDHVGGSTDYSLDRFIPVTFTGSNIPTVTNSVSRSAGKIVFTIVNKKGKTLTLWVGARKIVKKITSNSYTVRVTASKSPWFTAVAYVGGKKVLTKRFSN